MGVIGKIKHSKVKKAYENGAGVEIELHKGQWIHWKNPKWSLWENYRIKK